MQLQDREPGVGGNGACWWQGEMRDRSGGEELFSCGVLLGGVNIVLNIDPTNIP